jgi:protein-S-isoprenylcysteine O-methyltransferase Ste14
MASLETKIPPPVVALLFAIAMWGIAKVTPSMDLPASFRIAVSGLTALGGLTFSLAGILAFRSAKTTINPLKPRTASTLVTSGVYRLTRNPMYVGLLLVLVSWATYLSSAWAFAGPVGFVLYITRFQIVPEEQAMLGLFGQEFEEYRQRTRRWL